MDRQRVCLWTGGGFEIWNDQIWFVPHWVNALCCFDRKSGQLEKMVRIPGITTASAGFHNLKKTGNRIVLIPAFERSLYLYDMDTGRIHAVGPQLTLCALEKFQECIQWNDSLYLFPFGYDCIIRLDMTDLRTTLIPLQHVAGQFCDSCQIQRLVYLVNRTNQLAAFDPDTERFYVYLADGEKCFRTVTKVDGDTLLITDESSEMYLFHIRKSGFEKMAFTGIPANQSLVSADDIYLFPLRDQYAVTKISMDGTRICRYEMEDTSRYYKWPSVAAGKIHVDGHHISFMNPNHQCLYEFDSKKGSLDSRHFMVDEWEEELCGYFFGLSGTEGIYQEGKEKFASPEYFMEHAKRREKGMDNAGGCPDSTDTVPAGETIYRLMSGHG